MEHSIHACEARTLFPSQLTEPHHRLVLWQTPWKNSWARACHSFSRTHISCLVWVTSAEPRADLYTPQAHHHHKELLQQREFSKHLPNQIPNCFGLILAPKPHPQSGVFFLGDLGFLIFFPFHQPLHNPRCEPAQFPTLGACVLSTSLAGLPNSAFTESLENLPPCDPLILSLKSPSDKLSTHSFFVYPMCTRGLSRSWGCVESNRPKTRSSGRKL